jgi:hypothetical protein
MNAKKQPPWTVEKVAGRLIQIRVNGLDSPYEVQRFSEAIQKAAAATRDAVLIVDLRTPIVFEEAVANAVIELMTKANNVRTKTAILLAADHKLFGLQLRRLARQAGDPQRQTFEDPDEMLSWIGDALNTVEKRHAKEFADPRTRESTN